MDKKQQWILQYLLVNKAIFFTLQRTKSAGNTRHFVFLNLDEL